MNFTFKGSESMGKSQAPQMKIGRFFSIPLLIDSCSKTLKEQAKEKSIGKILQRIHLGYP